MNRAVLFLNHGHHEMLHAYVICTITTALLADMLTICLPSDPLHLQVLTSSCELPQASWIEETLCLHAQGMTR